ncbi:MAG TPA: translation initiation factor IF-2 [Candidatus Lachnoclostridium avicola]|nr:translation initiation factor IF-2 [Candidatus Lachnoclostridium avicola]
MRVSDLAKEVGKTSKEVLDILQKNHVEVKSNLSNVTDEHIELVKKAVSGGDKPADGGKEEKKGDAPKKKIAAVFRPQNSQQMRNRPARPQGQGRAEGAQGGGERQPRDSRSGQGGYSRDGGNRGDGNRQGSYSRDGGNRGDGSRQGGYNRDGGNRGDGNRQGGYSRDGGNRGDGSRQGGYNRDGGNRGDGSRQGGYSRDGGNRGDGNRQGGYNRDGGNRGDGNRQGGYSRDGGNRGDGNRQGGNRQGGGRQGGFSGRKDSGKSSSYDTPIQTKPQSNRQNNKNSHKNDKFDKRDREEEMPLKGGKVNKHPFQKPVEKPVEETVKSIVIPEVLTIKELAEKMKLQPSAIIKKLFLQGKVVTVNQEIDYEQAEEIALEYDVLCEKEEKVDVIAELLKEDEESEEDMVPRPPVVCVMGHVDHGKTSLLDAIRQTNVTAKEAGGITQHIGAYVVEINGQKITFLDTPGHEAFTAMRMRGAQATDIAILVVAADDGVMPQTVEAISHAKAAGVEIIVAINKIDKPSANIDRVKQELSEYELIPEDWGGTTICVPVSAHTKEGIQDLLEMILLTAEVKELKANPNRKARGLVIEAELDKGKGPVATVLVQKGTLHVGDNVAVGPCHGKVRAMMDDKGRRVKEAGPSTPVEILGLNDVPGAGEIFMAMDSDKDARHFAETFIAESKNKLIEETKTKLSLDDLFSQIKAGNVKELPLIVKADVQGSVEAVKQSLVKLSNEEVVVKVIHGGVGAINESDVSLAAASNAIIIGFNVRPDATAKSVAEQEKVDIRLYRVIYQAIEDVEAAMKGMLDPVYEEKVIGHAVIRQIFKASGVGNIAGCYVLDGKFQRDCSCRVTRDGEKLFDGKLASLKRFKDDVKEVAAGYECGLVFEKFNDIQEDDMVEAYTMVEVPR